MDVRVLSASEFESSLFALAQILCECVKNGASVSFMNDIDQSSAEKYWQGVLAKSKTGELMVLGAFVEGALAGTATLVLSTPPNQPHRADVSKVLVSPRYRRRGVAKALMLAIEEAAEKVGRDLLVLDTESGSTAETLYTNLGWQKVGEIPRFAFTPTGEPKPTSIFYKELVAEA